ncbi:MAG TPA: hypothetical protein VI386_06955 [Candidatus Sulfotelmatobacter sp.]
MFPYAANNWSLFGWDKNAWKTFFKTAVNPLPELREGGRGRAFLDAFSEGGLFPDGGPGIDPDALIKQAGSIAAAQYAVNQGLVVPLRSSIYRGILEGTETAASGAVLADVYTREAQGFSGRVARAFAADIATEQGTPFLRGLCEGAGDDDASTGKVHHATRSRKEISVQL